MMQRITEANDEALHTIENLEKNYDSLTEPSKERLSIEKNIIQFANSKGNIKDLIEIAEKTSFKANKAYIYYSIWQYNSDDYYKDESLKIFKELYKTKPKYRFKHFINKLS